MKKKAKVVVESLKKNNHGFILDSSQVIEKKVFTSFVHNDIFAFGMLLPKTLVVRNKKGEIEREEQQWLPAIVTSKRELIPYTKSFNDSWKVDFEAVPTRMPLRWKLELIKDFLDGKTEFPETKDIFNKCRGVYEKYCGFNNERWYDIHALWDMGTYLHQLFFAYPILENTSALPQTGKTKVLEIAAQTVLNAIGVEVNQTEATMFRLTNDTRYSKLLDEVETLFMKNPKTGREEGDKRVELVNASYKKGGAVPRVEKDERGKWSVVWYSVYSPTQLAGLKGTFGATADRSITHIHSRVGDKDSRGELEPTEEKSKNMWVNLRGDLYVWALGNWKNVLQEYETLKAPKIKKRDLQIWKPLLAIAKCVDEKTFNKVLSFAGDLSKRKREDIIPTHSQGWFILQALKQAIAEGGDKIYLQRVMEIYKELDKGEYAVKSNKTLSNKLDKLGFRDFRNSDYKGSFFEIKPLVFKNTVEPICPKLFENEKSSIFSSDSPDSPGSLSNLKKHLMKPGESNNKTDEKNNTDPDESDEFDESDECIHGDGAKTLNSLVDKSVKPIDDFLTQAKEAGIAQTHAKQFLEKQLSDGLWQEVGVGLIRKI